MKYVLDASAVLALLNGEEGADLVEQHLREASISAVNLVEVGTRLLDAGMTEHGVAQTLELLNLPVSDFNADAAAIAINLRSNTRAWGLSLGDRACLALAMASDAVALTADRAWADLSVGCEIQLIR